MESQKMVNPVKYNLMVAIIDAKPAALEHDSVDEWAQAVLIATEFLYGHITYEEKEEKTADLFSIN